MGNVDQLIKKYPKSPSGYKDVNPVTFTDAVKDRKTKETLEDLIARINFIHLPYVGSKESTRLLLDEKFRRKGLWIGYILNDKSLVVEYYNSNYIDDEHWKNNLYWLPYNTAGDIKLNEEDLTITSQGISLADRDTSRGMGKVILRETTPISEQLLFKNTIYEIRYDFDLTGKTLEIPEGCVLDFQGGSLNNGTIKGNINLVDVREKIFNNVLFELDNTTIKSDFIRPEWFGAKGDYDYNTHSGTDDSDAFNQAINASNILRCPVIKLSAVPYFINKDINITVGQLVFEGVYGGLREDYTFYGTGMYPGDGIIKNNQTSSLVLNGHTDIIRITGNVAYPIRFINVNFFNDLRGGASDKAKAISFESTFTGPLWPFIIQYCHFEGFDKAVYFDFPGEQHIYYNVYKIIIQHCSFIINNWCVYSKVNNTDYNNLDSLLYNIVPASMTWDFEFTDNFCHSNTNLLLLWVRVGNCIIERNNLEGSLSYVATDVYKTERTLSNTEYQSYLRLDSGVSLSYKSNHNEAATKKLLYIRGSQMKLNISGNDSYELNKMTSITISPFASPFSGEKNYIMINEFQPDFEIHYGASFSNPNTCYLNIPYIPRIKPIFNDITYGYTGILSIFSNVLPIVETHAPSVRSGYISPNVSIDESTKVLRYESDFVHHDWGDLFYINTNYAEGDITKAMVALILKGDFRSNSNIAITDNATNESTVRALIANDFTKYKYNITLQRKVMYSSNNNLMFRKTNCDIESAFVAIYNIGGIDDDSVYFDDFIKMSKTKPVKVGSVIND